MANLLPCPFCGKPTEYVCENDHHGDYFRLGCTDEDCPAHWTYYTEPQENAEKCIRRWNTRAAPPQSSAATEPLMDAGSIFTYLRERMADETSDSLAIACRALADHLRVLRDVPQGASK